MPFAAAAQSPPLLSLWYRGGPAGVPRAQDLADIRALGFTAVTWPQTQAAAVSELTRLANASGLKILERPAPRPAAPGDPVRDEDFVDLRPDRLPAGAAAPMIWRAIGHGARVVSCDSPVANRPPWLAEAAAVARQLNANGPLFANTRRGPRIDLGASPKAMDAALLDAGRSWLLIATNASAARARGEARLPPPVPYAMWLSLLDGSTMAMLEQREGPKWAFDLEAWGVRVYVIDKILK